VVNAIPRPLYTWVWSLCWCSKILISWIVKKKTTENAGTFDVSFHVLRISHKIFRSQEHMCNRSRSISRERWDVVNDILDVYFSVVSRFFGYSLEFIDIDVCSVYEDPLGHEVKLHKSSCKVEGCLMVHLPHEIMWNANLMQQRNFIDGILSSTCFGHIRPFSGASDVELQHVVFCTEFLDGRWSWEPLRRSCVRCGWCRATHLMLLMMGDTRNMSS